MATMQNILINLAKNSNIDFSNIDYSKKTGLREKKERQLQEQIEEARQFNEKKKKRLMYSNIPRKFIGLKFSDLNINKDNEKIIKLCHKAVENIDNLKKGFYLYGNCGVGKTTLIAIMAQLLGNHKGKEIYFASEEDILAEIRNAYNKDSDLQDTDIIINICKNDIVFIDEIGQNTTEWSLRILKRIIDECIGRRKLMFITSNYTHSELIKLWTKTTNEVLALQVVDRLQEITKIIKLDGESWRQK